ncbi:thioesterase family protein [Naumannella halotolerans]|uniref:Acyl-CoA thioesterase n=1 Tax=Naumannella halotolerans TaxID=993414 RepID=A0A4R7J7W8_9ACTN|nr:thioesterase family protein [Naumannella halotolerans]TDT32553.1 acyl-CoA thioesterase [Naumannella halotolerans]
MNSFDASTQVERSTDDPGVSTGSFDGSWQVGNGINGGVVLSTTARGLAAALGDDRHPDPLAITGTYLSASTAGPLTVTAEVARRGGSISSGTATLAQPDAAGALQTRAIVQGVFGDLSQLPDDSEVRRDPPQMPAPEDCLPATMAPPHITESAKYLNNLDLRFDPATVQWALGQPARRGMIQAWVRFPDGREPDPFALLFLVDCLPPVLADFGRFGWSPTLQLSAYIRARPAPGALLVRHETEHVSGGQFEEDVRIWDSEGTLVAQGRQLARTPRA